MTSENSQQQARPQQSAHTQRQAPSRHHHEQQPHPPSSDRGVRTVEDVLRLMDGLFAPDADRWSTAGGSPPRPGRVRPRFSRDVPLRRKASR